MKEKFDKLDFIGIKNLFQFKKMKPLMVKKIEDKPKTGRKFLQIFIWERTSKYV